MATLEGLIRRRPEQYLWVHQRFKRRPDGSRRRY
jgi:KDO2-lipid IV(A) lauroyltransferase